MAASGEHVYVADFGNHRIQKFTREGAFVLQWGRRGSGPGEFDGPAAIAVDDHGAVYVADFFNHRVQKFDSDGAYQGAWGRWGPGDGEFGAPVGVAVDGDGHVFVADLDQRRVQRFGGDGTFLGSWEPPAGSRWNAPWGLAADPSGELLVVDRGDHRVHRFDAAGRWLGAFGGWGSRRGNLRAPAGVAIAEGGTVLVADYGNRRIERFTRDGADLGEWGGEAVGGALAIAASRGQVFVVESRAERVTRMSGAGTAAAPRPTAFALALAGPNPSPRGIVLRVEVPAAGRLRMDVYDVHGRNLRRLADRMFEPGVHTLQWDARGESSDPVPVGVYFIRGRYESEGHAGVAQRRVVVVR